MSQINTQLYKYNYGTTRVVIDADATGENAFTVGNIGIGVDEFLVANAAAGTAAYEQSGGLIEAYSRHAVGCGSGAVGTFTLSDGELYSTNTDVGGSDSVSGTGTFIQEGGTHVTISWFNGSYVQDGRLRLGRQSGSSGTYDLSGGELYASAVWVGERGTGTFYQSGGLVYGYPTYEEYDDWFTPGRLVIGAGTSGTGRYEFSAGSIDCRNPYSGSGGSVEVASGTSSHGTFEMTGGTIETDNVTVGLRPQSEGVFNQSAGTVLAGLGTHPLGMRVGYYQGSHGEYNLSGSGVLSMREPEIGSQGQATFNQTGGTVSVKGTLNIGCYSTASGTYNFTGGTLQSAEGETGSLSVRAAYGGGGASGAFQGRGTVNLTGTLINNGRVISDAAGNEANVLDLTAFAGVTNVYDNPQTNGTNGWFAVNKGKLILGPLPDVTDGTYNWGENPSDEQIDLVNSLSMTFSGVSTSDDLAISLLDWDRQSDAGRLWRMIGVWDVHPGSFAFGENGQVTMTARYDDAILGTFMPPGSTEAPPQKTLCMFQRVLDTENEINDWVDVSLTTSAQVDTDYKLIYSRPITSLETYPNPPDHTLFAVGYLGGDATMDGEVNLSDYGILSVNYLRTGMTWSEGDFNGDGTVNISDVAVLSVHFGESCGCHDQEEGKLVSEEEGSLYDMDLWANYLMMEAMLEEARENGEIP